MQPHHHCREQEDGQSLVQFELSNEQGNDKLEVLLGRQEPDNPVKRLRLPFPRTSRAPKKGFVPIKISVSEDENSPERTFTFKYTVEQVKRPTCRKHGDIEL